MRGWIASRRIPLSIALWRTPTCSNKRQRPRRASRRPWRGLIHPVKPGSRIPQIVTALVEHRYLAMPVTTEASPSQPVDGHPLHRRYRKGREGLQHDYDIRDDGVIGVDALSILNVRPGDHARSGAVAMERLRWLTRRPPAVRIDVILRLN